MNGNSQSRAHWIPVVLILLGVLTAGMLVVALGVMFDVLPAFTPTLSGEGTREAVTLNRVLPIGSSLIGITFVATLLVRYGSKGGAHLLVWAIGLGFFATGSVMESVHGLFGWQPWAFRLWYLFGAVLISAWMGQGTVYLLAPRWVARGGMAVLLVSSAYATFKVFSADLDSTMLARSVATVRVEDGFTRNAVLADVGALYYARALDDDGRLNARRLSPLARAISVAAIGDADTLPVARLDGTGEGPDIRGTVNGHEVLAGRAGWLVDNRIVVAGRGPLRESEPRIEVAIDNHLAGTIALRPAIFLSGHAIISPGVRGLTPFFNTYGIIWLIGGAIYSSWLFWRSGRWRNRAVGNVLIAAGAILGGGGSAFARFGVLSFLYVVEIISLLVMFAGFVVATRTGRPVVEGSESSGE